MICPKKKARMTQPKIKKHVEETFLVAGGNLSLREDPLSCPSEIKKKSAIGKPHTKAPVDSVRGKERKEGRCGPHHAESEIKKSKEKVWETAVRQPKGRRGGCDGLTSPPHPEIARGRITAQRNDLLIHSHSGLESNCVRMLCSGSNL